MLTFRTLIAISPMQNEQVRARLHSGLELSVKQSHIFKKQVKDLNYKQLLEEEKHEKENDEDMP